MRNFEGFRKIVSLVVCFVFLVGQTPNLFATTVTSGTSSTKNAYGDVFGLTGITTVTNNTETSTFNDDGFKTNDQANNTTTLGVQVGVPGQFTMTSGGGSVSNTSYVLNADGSVTSTTENGNSHVTFSIVQGQNVSSTNATSGSITSSNPNVSGTFATVSRTETKAGQNVPTASSNYVVQQFQQANGTMDMTVSSTVTLYTSNDTGQQIGGSSDTTTVQGNASGPSDGIVWNPNGTQVVHTTGQLAYIGNTYLPTSSASSFGSTDTNGANSFLQAVENAQNSVANM